MSQEFTIYKDNAGSVTLFIGCSGRFYDVHDSYGRYVESVSTEAAAKELLSSLAGCEAAPAGHGQE